MNTSGQTYKTADNIHKQWKPYKFTHTETGTRENGHMWTHASPHTKCYAYYVFCKWFLFSLFPNIPPLRKHSPPTTHLLIPLTPPCSQVAASISHLPPCPPGNQVRKTLSWCHPKTTLHLSKKKKKKSPRAHWQHHKNVPANEKYKTFAVKTYNIARDFLTVRINLDSGVL